MLDCAPVVLLAGAVEGVDLHRPDQVQVEGVGGPLVEDVDDVINDLSARGGGVALDGPDTLFVGGKTLDFGGVPALGLLVVDGPGQVGGVGCEGHQLGEKIAVSGGWGGRLDGLGSGLGEFERSAVGFLKFQLQYIIQYTEFRTIYYIKLHLQS